MREAFAEHQSENTHSQNTIGAGCQEASKNKDSERCTNKHRKQAKRFVEEVGRSDSEQIESKDDDTLFEPTDADVADDDKNDDDDDEGRNECLSILL